MTFDVRKAAIGLGAPGSASHPKPTYVRTRIATVVTGYTTGIVDLTLGGDTQTIPSVRCLSSVRPVAGDIVSVLQDGTSLLVIGIISATVVWSTPTLGSHIVDFGGSYDGPRYTRDSMGYVHLRGLLKANATTTADQALITMPAGFRPGVIEVFACYGSTSSGAVAIRLDIDTAGVASMTPTMTNNQWISVNGVTYLAEN